MAWGRKHTAAQKPAWSQDDYHSDFAAKIKDQIEQGVAPWQKPWKPGEERLPKNIQSGKPYRGGNSVYLSVTQTAKGYGDNRWATYKQIKDMGGQVRKGEKATHVLFYKFDDETQKAQDQPDRPTTERKAEREHTRPPMVRCYAVFNVAQADGLQLERKGDDREHEPEWKAHQTAERVIQESGIHVAHVRGDRAFYNLQSDTVTLPEREQFATAASRFIKSQTPSRRGLSRHPKSSFQLNPPSRSSTPRPLPCCPPGCNTGSATGGPCSDSISSCRRVAIFSLTARHTRSPPGHGFP